MPKKRKPKKQPFWKTFFIFLVILIALFSIIAYLSSQLNGISTANNKIVLIPIIGPISDTGIISGIIPKQGISASKIINDLERASKDKSVKGIILDINSPGGTVVASQELAEAVKKVEKPVIALLEDTAASGAYWVASAADVIVAHPMTITGSIGVTSSYLEFSGLMEQYGVSYQRFVSGPYKDIGSPYRKPTEEDEKILNYVIDKIHNYFVKEVSKNRDKDLSGVASGGFYLGVDAKRLGLVDEIGTKELAINITKQRAGIEKAKLVIYTQDRSLLSLIEKLSSNIAFYVGAGIGSQLFTSIEQNRLKITV